MGELRVCLDPGHGWNYNKGVCDGYFESNRVFELAYYLKAELEKYEDTKVFVTKSTLNENPNLAARGKFARDNNCELFLSLHSNAFSSSSAVGVSTYYSMYRPESRSFIDALGKAVTDLMQKDTGVTYYRGSSIRKYPAPHQNWDYYGVIRNAVNFTGDSCVKIACLIEHGFHTNVTECTWLNNSDHLKSLAALEAQVIANHYGKSLKSEVDVPSLPDQPENTYEYYKVVKGDTLSAIANKYHTTVAAIVSANSDLIKNPNSISIGWNLKIPATASAEESKPSEPVTESFNKLDKVKFKSGVHTWSSGVAFPSWMANQTLYIRSAPRDNGKNIVVSTLKEGAVSGVARIADLYKVESTASTTPVPAPTPAKAPDVIYQIYSGGKWWSKITNYNIINSKGYAGAKSLAASGIKCQLTSGHIEYRVHLVGGGWLNWIKDCNDFNSMGYAGILGKPFDLFQARLVDVDGYEVEYRVSNVKKIGYWSWIKGYNPNAGCKSYAGSTGKAVNIIQMRIVKK